MTAMHRSKTLVVRLDNVGDVVLTGPAVRAVAAHSSVTYLAGPGGAAAARLLPGVDEVLVFDAPWVAYDAAPLEPRAIDRVVGEISARSFDTALVLTSFHQSALPMALLARMAGVPHVVATSVDYPGSLLDVRLPYDETAHEVIQSLSVARAAGFELPAHDDGRLRLRPEVTTGDLDLGRYVVVHPGASVPARALPFRAAHDSVPALVDRGWHVVVTGGATEVDTCRAVAGERYPGRVHVLAGQTSLDELADVLAHADVVVCGNTGAAHVAAAVGTPVVEAFAPVVDPRRWHPWGVPYLLLGHLEIGCAGCRSRVCPLGDEPCLNPVTASAVVSAVDLLVAAPRDGGTVDLRAVAR
ncbi:MAG: glycosyltransferase family 9 protein [Acidimicrobiia bacterium]